MRVGWIGCIGCVILMGCGGQTGPQRPVYHGKPQLDTTVVELLTMHQQMASRADDQLAKRVTPDFVLMDENYWVSGLRNAGDKVLRDGDYIELEAAFYTLDGKLLVTHQASTQVGRVDEIQAISMVLPHMQRTMKVSMLVPWYLAFGSAGNADIPPYENIRVELQVQ